MATKQDTHDHGLAIYTVLSSPHALHIKVVLKSASLGL